VEFGERKVPDVDSEHFLAKLTKEGVEFVLKTSSENRNWRW